MDNQQIKDVAILRETSQIRITDVFPFPPVVLRIDDSIIGTLGNFSASTGKAKSKKTFNICAIASAVDIPIKLTPLRQFKLPPYNFCSKK